MFRHTSAGGGTGVEEHRGGWRWLAALAVAAAVAGGVATRDGHDPSPAQPPASSAASAPRSSPPSRPAPTSTTDHSPARLAAQVVKHADSARVNPHLLMAIAYNESNKPHDPALERAWQKIKPDAALGITNMHKAAFDEAKQGRGFADRNWQELPDDPDLAIEAAAWHLHDLAAQLPPTWPAPYTRDELLALGYNAGANNMKAFAHGATPGEVAQSYLDRLHGNWTTAGEAIRSLP
ncbi:MAG: transglycosylase SLT domain-containing protein [Streptosporangiales bacterium]|nr:transglycosylase SLT domain-containing protein [Streptosporangiales bacterium]